MEAERLKKIEEIYHAALVVLPDEREAFFLEKCGADEDLRREIESLLSFESQADNFLDISPQSFVAEMFAEKDAQNDLIGKHFGHYKIGRLLGRGGMGEVYLADDTNLKRQVALKFLPEELTANADRLKRFEREAQTASGLNHPNIVTIHQFGTDRENRFIVSEYVKGITLSEKMESGRLSVRELLDIAAQIAAALAAAHEAGIIHRDIKPDNIMIRRDGIVKVLDFGLAKLVETVNPNDETEVKTRTFFKTNPGVVMGTVRYMSPEQARGLETDARTDVWSLGVVLYEMIAGRAPFEGETASHIIVSILEREPALLARFTPHAPAELERIVRKCLTKERDERYRTAHDPAIDFKNLRRELDVRSELERSAAPDINDALTTRIEGIAPTGETSLRRTTRVGTVITEIKRHQKGSILIAALAAFVIAASILFFHLRSAPSLTEKDTILLTDFVNTTGDSVFDGTLKQALAVQLGQSPFLNIFSEDRARVALKFMGRSPDERLTRDIGREICQRQGLKAMLAGSIASLGNH